MTDVNRVWSMKDTDRVSQGKGILQQSADLKDSSRLKLIEIPFVAFVVCSVSIPPHPSPSTRSLFQCSQSEPSVSLNIKQIRLHLWRTSASNLHGNNIKLWDFVMWTAIKKCVFVCAWALVCLCMGVRFFLTGNNVTSWKETDKSLSDRKICTQMCICVRASSKPNIHTCMYTHL